MKTKKEISIEIEEKRAMADAEVETLATLLFRWWKRELEYSGQELNRRKEERK